MRIDTTLVGFDASTWQRGQQSFIFRFSQDHTNAQLILLDHDRHEVGDSRDRGRHFQAQLQSLGTAMRDVTGPLDSAISSSPDNFTPSEEAIVSRLTSPIATTYIDVDRIGFERSKTGGWLSWIASADRCEQVEGYDCKVRLGRVCQISRSSPRAM